MYYIILYNETPSNHLSYRTKRGGCIALDTTHLKIATLYRTVKSSILVKDDICGNDSVTNVLYILMINEVYSLG